MCNGFQILAEMGLLAGALTRNLHQRFECGDWYVRVAAEGPFTRKVGESCGGSRLFLRTRGASRPTPGLLQAARGRGLIGLPLLRRTGSHRGSRRTRTPASALIMPGIYSGPRKNVFGLMPHPERMAEAFLGGADGKKLFDAVLSAA